ncbi:hypothetical protein L6164_008038 [Bauhinia variegata]|uniref:Uncharacterized protein n=1 Tax=Bauhinia variegata TaxID=167791 RepID=A0ACB9PEB2_BAUVA|nr:hypothetical protein L6164_008038 [Bauhinia variegata]
MDTYLSLLITISSFFLTTLPLSHGKEGDYYTACSTTYNCGDLTNISYPFWGQNRSRYCGGSDMLKLTCDQNGTTSIEIGSQNFTVLSIYQSPFTVRLARKDLVLSSCISDNTSLDSTVFYYNPDKVENLTLFYNCPQRVSESLPGDFKNNFTCHNESSKCDERAFYVDQTQLRKYEEQLLDCGVQVQVPVLRDVPLGDGGGIQALRQLLEHGFDVLYYSVSDFPSCVACDASGGKCGRRFTNTFLFSCHCRDGAHDLMCPQKGMISLLF